jgi:xylulokinase
MCYLMGIDLGTSSLKVIVMDEQGNIKAFSSQAYDIESPSTGYAEQQPEIWWQACCSCIRACLTRDISAKMIKCVGFSGQMHGLVLLDRNHQVIRPAIIHCDARSGVQVQTIKNKLGKETIERTVLNPIYTGFLLPSLCWVRDNEPHLFERVHQTLLPKDYLRYKLTGMIATDYSDASATLAFDIKGGCWSKEILDKVDTPISYFPQCYDADEVIGEVSRAAAAATGLEEGTPVVCGGGDQVMQSIGNGVTAPGTATINIGSSGQVFFPSDKAIVNPKLNTNTFCSYQKDSWFTMGATMSAGLSLKWFSSLYQHDYTYINEQIREIEPGSGGLIFLPYLNGERTPHVNEHLSGMLVGLGFGTDMPRIAHSVMEGVSFSLMQCIETCSELGLSADRFIASGGGAQSKVWLQMQADIYNVPLYIAKTKEQAAVGAAIAAGSGTGVYKNIPEGCQFAVKYEENVITPNKENHEQYMEYYQLYKRTYLLSKYVLEETARTGRKSGARN